MAYYHPCRGCKVDKATCPRREEIRQAVAGYDITSVKFRCNLRRPVFDVGEAVKVTWPMYDSDYAEDPLEPEFRATVLKELAKARYLIAVEPGEDLSGIGFVAPDCLNSGGYANVSFERLRSLGEPERREVCPECLGVEGQADLETRCQGFARYCMIRAKPVEKRATPDVELPF